MRPAYPCRYARCQFQSSRKGCAKYLSRISYSSEQTLFVGKLECYQTPLISSNQTSEIQSNLSMDTYFFCIASQTGSYGIKVHYSSSSKPNPFVLYEEVGLFCSPSEKNDEIVALVYSRSTKPSTQFEVTV